MQYAPHMRPPGVLSEGYFATPFANDATPGFDRKCSAPDDDLPHDEPPLVVYEVHRFRGCVCVCRQSHEDVGQWLRCAIL